MTLRVAVRSIVVIALALLAQTTVVLDVRVGGVTPDVMLLLPVAAGIVAGPFEGAVVGFVAGLAADLLVPTPFGLSALVGTVVGFAVGAATGEAASDVWWFSSAVALAASAVAVVLYAVLGAVLGEDQFLHVDLGMVLAVVSVCNAVLAWPAVQVERWALVPAEYRAGRRPATRRR